MIQIIDNWQDLPFEKYLQIKQLHEKQLDILDEDIEYISLMTSLPTEEVRRIKFVDIQALKARTEFFAVQPDYTNATYKWKIKSLEDVTMDDYITFARANNGDETNFASILTFMTKNGLTEDEILKMPTPEVLNGFFLLSKKLSKLINSSLLSLLWKEMKKKVTKKLAPWRRK